MSSLASHWSPAEFCIAADATELSELAPEIYGRTCRTNFEQPGFCVLNLGTELGSVGLRRAMIALQAELATIHESVAGETLVYLSVARFDQQTTTRPHRDGGPDECFLMLGYEPSEVDSELELADYARCAYDLGVSPQQFLSQFNPMFHAGKERLQPYTTRPICFSRRQYQIVCINNSLAPYSTSQPHWQGVLHTATILAPDDSQRRVINSTMIAPAPIGTTGELSAALLEEFATTSAVRRQGYDKQHLQDDA